MQNKFRFTMSGILATLAMVLMLRAESVAASASKVLYKFKGGTDGGHPVAGLIFDTAGNLYGTTLDGGGHTCCGTVFKLTPNSDGRWTESVLYRFAGGSDGQQPAAGLIFDSAGSLYGTTTAGGSTNCGCGTVFKLTLNSDGSWTESVLYRFAGSNDGAGPYAGLIFDGAGNLYGTTVAGGASGTGTVFKLTPNSDGSWTESVLHAFSGPDGGDPQSGLIFDPTGNLYGTTTQGGAGGAGIVFKLTPNSNGSWTEHVLRAFTGGKDGGRPYDALIFDAAGESLRYHLAGWKSRAWHSL